MNQLKKKEWLLVIFALKIPISYMYVAAAKLLGMWLFSISSYQQRELSWELT